MEKAYQLFYRDSEGVKKLNLRATTEDMARKFFECLRPDAEIVKITDDVIPMEVDYVRQLSTTNMEDL